MLEIYSLGPSGWARAAESEAILVVITATWFIGSHEVVVCLYVTPGNRCCGQDNMHKCYAGGCGAVLLWCSPTATLYR